MLLGQRAWWLSLDPQAAVCTLSSLLLFLQDHSRPGPSHGSFFFLPWAVCHFLCKGMLSAPQMPASPHSPLLL